MSPGFTEATSKLGNSAGCAAAVMHERTTRTPVRIISRIEWIDARHCRDVGGYNRGLEHKMLW